MNMDNRGEVLDCLTGWGLCGPAMSVSQWKGQEPISSSVYSTLIWAGKTRRSVRELLIFSLRWNFNEVEFDSSHSSTWTNLCKCQQAGQKQSYFLPFLFRSTATSRWSPDLKGGLPASNNPIKNFPPAGR